MLPGSKRDALLMNKDEFDFVAPSNLRLGLFVDLDLGWLSHPFATRRFKISNEQQLAELRSLGLERVRYVPARSDPLPIPAPVAAATEPAVPQPLPHVAPTSAAARQGNAKADQLQAQQAGLQACERCFSEATQQYSKHRHCKPASRWCRGCWRKCRPMKTWPSGC